MNIFTNQEALLGDIPVNRLVDAFVEFFTQAGDIHARLGKKSYLLENYLSLLFKAISETYGNDIGEEGVEPDLDLYAVCRVILKPQPKPDQPFLKVSADFVKSHPLDFQDDQTQTYVYMALLSNGYLEASMEEYRHKLCKDLSHKHDPQELEYLYATISELLGEEAPIEQLNLLFLERFLVVSAIAVYFKSINNKLLDALTSRDDESSLQIFQLFLRHRLFEQIL